MSPNPNLWKRLASEIDDALHEDLGGARPSSEGRRIGGAVRTRGAVRVRGPGRTQPSRLPERTPPVPVVIVDVAPGAAPPSEKRVRSRLKLTGAIDLYYVRPSTHWAALGPRELNPDDRERGHEHLLILRNLRPDYALVAAGEARPEWSRAARAVMSW